MPAVTHGCAAHLCLRCFPIVCCCPPLGLCLNQGCSATVPLGSAALIGMQPLRSLHVPQYTITVPMYLQGKCLATRTPALAVIDEYNAKFPIQNALDIPVSSMTQPTEPTPCVSFTGDCPPPLAPPVDSSDRRLRLAPRKLPLAEPRRPLCPLYTCFNNHRRK